MKRVPYIIVIVLLLCVIAYLYYIPFISVNTRKIDSRSISDLSTVELIEIRDIINSKLSAEGSLFGYTPWYSTGIGSLLPNPDEVLGKKVTGNYSFATNTNEKMQDAIFGMNDDDISLYTTACMAVGFVYNMRMSNNGFEADNIDGIHLDFFNFEKGNTVKEHECHVNLVKKQDSQKQESEN